MSEGGGGTEAGLVLTSEAHKILKINESTMLCNKICTAKPTYKAVLGN